MTLLPKQASSTENGFSVRPLATKAVVASLLLGVRLATAAVVVEEPPEVLVLEGTYYNAYSRIAPREFRPGPGAEGAPTATFQVTYNGFPGPAQAAFQHAVDIWAQLISSPVTIRVEANFTVLPPPALGNAGSNRRWQNFLGAPQANTAYTDVMTDALGQADFNPGESDIVANFASNIGNWYFGTDGNTPAGQFDFVTVVLHELGHGIGYSGFAGFDDGVGQQECRGVVNEGCIGNFPGPPPNNPSSFDPFTENGSGVALFGGFPNPSLALGSELRGGDIFFNAPGPNAANGGSPPELYAPIIFQPGSSYSHFDEATFPPGNAHSLMTPQLALAESIHDPGNVALCMFEAMGLVTSADCAGGNPVMAPILINQFGACANPPAGASAAISTHYSDFARGVEAADHFSVPVNESWVVDRIEVGGTYSVGAPNATSINVTIWDGAGAPVSEVCMRPGQAAFGGFANPSFRIDLNSPCTLSAGSYWLDVQPIIDTGGANPLPAWFWFETNVGNGQYLWRDSTNLFGSGCTDFSLPNSCGVGGTGIDLCFGLLGDKGIFVDGFESGNTSAWSSTSP